MDEQFYKQQSDLTAAKIYFYENYIGTYLIKILMGFGSCFICDLFCGTGKNGEENGSPVVLLNTAEYILATPQLKKKRPKIYIFFNDREKKFTDNLISELNGIAISKNIEIFLPQNHEFEIGLEKAFQKVENNPIPKFFFLDPFTYSNVKMEHLRKIMALRNSEVLLFLPVFHSYRFANDIKLQIKEFMIMKTLMILCSQ